MKVELACEGKDGEAWLCGRCEGVHVRWKSFTATFTRAEFEGLAKLASTAGRALERRAGPVVGHLGWAH